MRKEVKVALIGGAVTVLVAIIAGIFGLLGNGKQPSSTPQSKATAEQQSENNGNQVGDVKAGGTVTIQQTTIGK